MSNAESSISRSPTNVEKLRGLPWGVAWSVTNSIFAQYTFFGSIFVLFLNALGLDKTQIGSLLSLLPFLSIIAVFIAPAVARYGYKRTSVVSFGGRAAVAAFLLLTPSILNRFGGRVTLVFIIATVGVFGLFRAIGFTAFYPWLQEQVPDSMRGKYTAVKNSLASLTAFVAMMIAGYVLGPDPDMSRFMILMAAGLVFGIVSVWASANIPGGAPVLETSEEQTSYREMAEAARDANFVRYLIGVGLVTLATVPLVSFVPLFMKEQVGLSSNHVVWLETGGLIGGLLSSYFWGWLADRYGSKPVMQSGLYLLALLPLSWIFMPRQVSWVLYLALMIAMWQGFFNTGWSIGSGRLLFVRVVPAEKRSAYMALYYAWMGIAGGLGQLLGGWLVDLTAGVSGQWWIVQLDPYTLLFVLGVILPLIGRSLLTRVKADSAVSVGQFAGMFLRGNPFLAMESVIRYHRARDERAAVAMTERLGKAKSPLTVEELLESLGDPRFFVRFEAIVSMARHRPDPRLTDALTRTLEGNDPALSTIAAWALGRMGDERALEALRRGLNARYRSVQAHCARSLGSLEDRTVAPILLGRLETEQDLGVRMAFSSALGKLGERRAIEPLLAMLQATQSEDARLEFALALARLVGEEHSFVQLQRRSASEPGTVYSQAVTAVSAKLAKVHWETPDLKAMLDSSAEAFARDELDRGVDLLRDGLESIPGDALAEGCGIVVRECAVQLGKHGLQRPEYMLLALHALDCRIA